MRSRGGIPSVFPIVAALNAVFMTSPLTEVLPVSTYMCVTGQYHKGDTKSTPSADADRRRIKRHETPSFTLVASLARASAARSRRRARRWIRPGGPADPGHGRAAMAWSDGRIRNWSDEPAHRRRAAEAPAMRTTILRYAANAGLIGVLALAAASSSFGQVRTQAPTGNELAQYCAPQDESADAHKFYCRSEV